MQPQLDYGNWIRKRNLLVLGLCVLGLGVLTLVPLGAGYQLTVAVLFVLVLVSFLFPLYAYVMFAQWGGRFQQKVYDVIVQSLGQPVRGRVLDIGSGNGVLAVSLAQRHPEAEVLGVDYWGKDWEYSKEGCENNARLAGVDRRVQFQKGDAAALGFAAETFDAAVSNLTFHEVKTIVDKRDLVREALRVVKSGGAFAFVDYFYETKYYGSASEFEADLRNLPLAHLEYSPLHEKIAMPLPLRHPKILGKVGIVSGRK